MAGILQASLATMRAFGIIHTVCIRCGGIESFRRIGKDGSHSYLCRCGCTIYKFHKPDEFHRESFFLKIFIPQYEYRGDWKKLDVLEQQGYVREEKNGKVIYRRESFNDAIRKN